MTTGKKLKAKLKQKSDWDDKANIIENIEEPFDNTENKKKVSKRNKRRLERTQVVNPYTTDECQEAAEGENKKEKGKCASKEVHFAFLPEKYEPLLEEDENKENIKEEKRNKKKQKYKKYRKTLAGDTGEWLQSKLRPAASAISITVSIADGYLCLNAPERQELQIPLQLPRSNTVKDCRMWGTDLQGRNCGDEASLRITRYLNNEKTFSLVLFESGMEIRRLQDTEKNFRKKREGISQGDGHEKTHVCMCDPSQQHIYKSSTLFGQYFAVKQSGVFEVVDPVYKITY